MRLITFTTRRAKRRRVRAIGTAAASLTLALAALGGASAAAQAASWTATAPTGAALAPDINPSDAPGGDVGVTSGVICTIGTVSQLQTAFTHDANQYDIGNWDSGDDATGQNTESLDPNGSWASPYAVLDMNYITNDANADFAQTNDMRIWYSPTGSDNTYALSSFGFPAGVNQLSCSYMETAMVYTYTGTSESTGDSTYERYETEELVGTPTTTTYEIEPDGAPTASFDPDGSPAAGSWVDGASPVVVDTGNLSSGDSPEVVCATPGGVFTATTSADTSVTIPASYGSSSGTNTYSCQVQNGLGQESSTISLSFNVDSQQPSGGFAGTSSPGSGALLATTPPAGPWNVPGVNYSGTDDYSVTMGPSGFGSGSCTVTDTDTNTYPGSGATDPDAGESTTYPLAGDDALTPPPGSTNPADDGPGAYSFLVPLYQGQNSVVCNSENGASASAPTYTATPLVDSVMPSVAFAGGTGTVTDGSTLWINSPTGTVNLTALAGASGLSTPLTGAEAGEGPAEDPNDASIACTPSNGNVAIGAPTSTSLITSSGLTSGQIADGYLIGVQNTYQPSGSGLTQLDCVSMNDAGVYQNSPLTQEVGIDTAHPSITLADGSNVSSVSDEWSNAWQPSTSGVTIDASTTGASGIAGVTCTVNGDPVVASAAVGNPTGGAGTYQYTLPAGSFANGSNAISCLSTSGDDLTSAADTQTLNLDATVPTIAAADLPANGWQTQDDVSFNSTSGPSGIASVVCTVDGGAPRTYEPTTGTSSWSVGVPLGGDGEHTADCVVTSGSGLTADTGSISIGADNQTPGITWTGVPASQWVSAAVPVTVTGTAGPSGVKSVTCQLDGGSWNTTTGSTASISITGSGSHTIECYSSSNSGLQSAIETQTVQVDVVVPTEAFSGAAAGQWLTNSTSEAVTVNATAGLSGVASIDCTIDGVAQTPVNPSSEQFDSATGTYSTSAAFPVTGNGTHTVTCKTVAGSGAVTAAQTEQIDIDASSPSIQLTAAGQPLVSGTWTSGPETITATANVGPSGISQTAYAGQGGLECSVDGGAEQITSSSSEQLAVSGQGQHSIVCSVTDGGNVSYSLPAQQLNIDSVTPTIGLSGATFGTETTQNQTVTVTAQSGQSGLDTPVCDVDGQAVSLALVTGGNAPTPAAGYVNAAAWTFPVSGAGDHTVQCNVQVPSGLTASTSVEQVLIDQPNTSQITGSGSSAGIDNGADPFSGGPSEKSWSTSAQTVVVTANPASNAAPITDIKCAGAAGMQGSGDYPANASNETSQGGEQVTVTVGDPGGDLVCTATDSAGQVYQLGGYDFLVDSHAPTGQILASSQWPEPNEIAITATDGANGSGVKSVDVTLTGNGLNDQIPTAYNQATGQWVATVNDAAIAAGSYSLKVTAEDNAGNSATIATDSSLQLPLRTATSLTVNAGFSTKTTAVKTKTSKSTKGHKKPSVKGKTAACKPAKAKKCAKATTVDLTHGAISTPYGQKVTVTGTLIDTNSRKPVAGAQLVVSSIPTTGGSSTQLATIQTNSNGDYSYVLPAGESRAVTVTAATTASQIGSSATFKQNVTGKVTVRAAKQLVAGKTATLTGKVAGGYIPTTGVQIHVQYEIPGVKAAGAAQHWYTFHSMSTTKTGSFKLSLPISKNAINSKTGKGYKYEFRVVIPQQSGWAYGATTSNTLVRVTSK